MKQHLQPHSIDSDIPVIGSRPAPHYPPDSAPEAPWLTVPQFAFICRVAEAINTAESMPFPFKCLLLDHSPQNEPGVGILGIQEDGVDGEFCLRLAVKGFGGSPSSLPACTPPLVLTASIIDTKSHKRFEAIYTLVSSLCDDRTQVEWSEKTHARLKNLRNIEASVNGGRMGGRSKWAGATPDDRAEIMKSVREARWGLINEIAQTIAEAVNVKQFSAAIETELDNLNLDGPRRQVIRNRVIASISRD